MKVVKDKLSHKEKEIAISNIMADDKLSLLEMKIMVTFVRCDENSYRPTIKTLMSQHKRSERWIKYALKKLKQNGYITIERIAPTNNNNTILYVHPKK